jgi:alpha-glucosidase
MSTEPAEPWYRRAVLYHVYPLSFADSNGDGYGDLTGIIDHLDYLNDGTADSLGIDAIWLSPVYVSPMADWGYDVADYTAIDPRFGTMADFERLLKEVHRRGMKLLMDFVPNHTSVRHSWFVEASSSRTNPKRDWYIWSDPGADGGAPNNWISSFGGPAWTLDEQTGQYYMHTFLEEQPDLNWRNPKVREAMLNVLRFWLEKGVDGFRADAVFGLIKDKQLRDDEPNPNFVPGISNPADELLRVHSAGQHELKEVLGSFCDVLAERAGTFLLSEAYLNIPGLHELYAACARHPIHAPFNFNLMKLPWGAHSYRNFIDDYEASLGPNDWPNYVLGNHDRHRLATRLGAERARMLAMLQLMLRGLPVVYYGDELGLPDAHINTKQLRDPLELRLPGHALGRDGARSPLPWTADNNAGFTEGTPWLPLNREAHRLNVEMEERDPESSLNFYRHLIHLRKHSPALVEGDYRSLDLANPYVYGFIRETELQRYLVLLNFDSHHARVKLKGAVGAWVAGTHLVQGDGLVPKDSWVTLEPYGGRVYELRRGGR